MGITFSINSFSKVKPIGFTCKESFFSLDFLTSVKFLIILCYVQFFRHQKSFYWNAKILDKLLLFRSIASIAIDVPKLITVSDQLTNAGLCSKLSTKHFQNT